MSLLLKLILVTFALSVIENDAKRILVMIPTPSVSHQIVYRPVVKELARRGHEVVFITTDPMYPKGKAPKNLTEIDVHQFHQLWLDLMEIATVKQKDTSFNLYKFGYEMLTQIFTKQIESDEVQRVLNEGNFDLLILEALIRPALALSHKFKVPVIQVSSLSAFLGNYENMGASTHPILYPSMMRQKILDISVWDVLTELYDDYLHKKIYNGLIESETAIMKKLISDDLPSLTELNNNVDTLFLNIDPLFECNRPLPLAVVYLGGLHQNPIKNLPDDLKMYLDSSINGVIYVSFGSNVVPSQFSNEKLQILLGVFSKLPYDILWKWDADELPGKPANIRISKWLPQSDLLEHPKIKLFITQAGLQSTDEAITAGVPLIGIPILGDQWYNVEQYRRYNIGLRLDMNSLTEEKLRVAVETILNDESYRQNVVKLRSSMRDRPQTSLERAIWWTEYVLQHGGAKHLRTPAANMSWQDYFELQLVTELLILCITVFAGLAFILYRILKYVYRKIFLR